MYASKEFIFKSPKITVKKRKQAPKPSVISDIKFRIFTIDNESKKGKKNDPDWQCMYCHRRWSDDSNDGMETKWIDCDSCICQMHLDCVPKRHLRKINYDPSNDDEGQDVNFVCEVCLHSKSIKKKDATK